MTIVSVNNTRLNTVPVEKTSDCVMAQPPVFFLGGYRSLPNEPQSEIQAV